MNAIKREFQSKQGKEYVTTYTQENECEVYKELAHCLIAKKINQCKYIRSIKRVQNYDGTITIFVYYIDGDRNVFTVADH